MLHKDDLIIIAESQGELLLKVEAWKALMVKKAKHVTKHETQRIWCLSCIGTCRICLDRTSVLSVLQRQIEVQYSVVAACMGAQEM